MTEMVCCTFAFSRAGSAEQWYFEVEIAKHKWNAIFCGTNSGSIFLEKIREHLSQIVNVQGPCTLAIVYGEVDGEVRHVNLDKEISSLH